MSDKDQRPSGRQLDRRHVFKLGAGLAMSASAGGSLFASKVSAESLASGLAPEKLLSGIDTIVVVMMENRSFDHYFGTINHDGLYPQAGRVEALSGSESNANAKGEGVSPYLLSSRTQADPPHDWDACHRQWNTGKNDGFVLAHRGKHEREVMGYFERDTLPFSYWLADNFTLCDHWFASVLGPTWPNRAVLHATSAAGLKTNRPYVIPPTTIWDVLPKVGKVGKNYYAGKTGIYPGLYAAKVLAGVNPTAPIDEFFRDAKAGKLPAFCMIDPDFESNDDHPSHDVQLGQAFMASIYQAMANSPQWSRCLCIFTYDEHGGFYDHVPPPVCGDADSQFQQLGFRVPSFVFGPTVQRGALCQQTLEHASVGATLKSCFGMPSLSRRMDSTLDVSACINPDWVGMPQMPPSGAPAVRLNLSALDTSLRSQTIHSQPELEQLLAAGKIPAAAIDPRSRSERVNAWLEAAHELGAVDLE